MDELRLIDDSLMEGKYVINPFMYDTAHDSKMLQTKEPRRKVAETCHDTDGAPSKLFDEESMKDKLYDYCVAGPSEDNNDELVGWLLSYLTQHEMKDMRPFGWVNSAVVDFAAMVLNLDQEASGLTGRWCLSSLFATKCSSEFARARRAAKIPLECGYEFFNLPRDWDWELIFTPICYESHWWCLALHKKELQFYVLDSMESIHKREKAALDKFIAYQLLEHLHLIDDTIAAPNEKEIRLDHPMLPKQHNRNDCGVYTMKYMELWDPQRKFDGHLSMPAWTEAHVHRLRRDIVVEWVLDERNTYKETTLTKASCISQSTVKERQVFDCDDVGPSVSPYCETVPMSHRASGKSKGKNIASRIAYNVKYQGRLRNKGRLIQTPFTENKKNKK